MTEKDYMLSKDLYTWILYATYELNMGIMYTMLGNSLFVNREKMHQLDFS